VLDDLVIVHPTGAPLFLALFILYPLLEAEQADLIAPHSELHALGLSLIARNLVLILAVALTIAICEIFLRTFWDVEELLLVVHQVLLRRSQSFFDLRQEN
jgi:hypothetical protein